MASGGDLPSQPLPLSLQEIENLVKILYEPGHGKKISETEATLRVLQRSPQGWDIGDALLGSTDEQVRFFGALTFTVKLNADSAGLSHEESEQLLSKLIFHLVTHPKPSAASRKLCSTLAQYFTKPISAWKECVKSLALSLQAAKPILDSDSIHELSIWDIVPQLPDAHLLLILDFATNVADEAKRISNDPNRSPHERLLGNAESIEALLQVSFGRGIKALSTPPSHPSEESVLHHDSGEKLCVAALKCFLGWIFYAQSEFKAAPEKMKHLRSVNELALTCLEYHVEDSMDFVAEILESYPAFLEPEHLQFLWSAITSPWGLEMLSNCDAETVALARIFIAYGQMLLDAGKLYREPTNPHYGHVLSFLHKLLQYPDSVGADDEVALVALDFWSSYVTTIAEESLNSPAEEVESWIESAKGHVLQTVSEFFNKINYPPRDVSKDWDADTKKTFSVFRMDVRDLIMEAFELLHDSLAEQFVNLTIQALEVSDWLRVEAGLFSIISLADALTGSDTILSRLFEQPLFTTIAADANIPAVCRRTTVDLVAALNHFFLRNPQFLPQVLHFLLGALAQPSLAHGASKSFASLCSECRKSLTSELGSFFQMYEQFLTYATAEEYTKSKVLEGIAAIVQAEATDEQRLVGLRPIFQYITNDASRAIDVTKETNDRAEGQVLASMALKCLAGVGKAMQSTDEDVVDLVESHDQSSFWTTGSGKEIQDSIIKLIAYLTQVFPANDDLLESACNVLRSGFRERGAGPFVLAPSASVDFITQCHLQTPRLTFVLETACRWVSAYKTSPQYEPQARRLLQYDLSLMQALEHPRTDPEVSVGCIELVQSFLRQDARILKDERPEVLQGTFGFSIECIKSPEVLPKRAAAALWKDIFEKLAASGTSDQSICQEITDHFGQAVTTALLYNVCGEVEFSSFENILAPLRRLLLSDRNARTYVTVGMAEQPLFASIQGVSDLKDMTRKFIESMIRNAKHSAAFKEAVKAFWQNCKQLQIQLAPQHMHHAHRFNY